jgi:RNA-splicing ligase RtcB
MHNIWFQSLLSNATLCRYAAVYDVSHNIAKIEEHMVGLCTS